MYWQYTIFGLLFFILSTNTYAQRDIKLSYEYDKVNGKYVFETQNLGNTYVTVVVNFKRLENLHASTSLPAIKTIGPGISKLFTLERSGPGSVDFDYNWIYWPGTHNAKVKDVQYVLPTTAGIKVSVFETNSVSETLGQEEDDEFYGLGFRLVDGDTICAIRGGVVETVQQETQTDTLTYTYTRNRNKFRIRHDDGTVAYYSNYKNGSAMIEEGDEVLAGSPLAIATQTNTRGDANVLIYVSALDIDPDRSKDYKEWNKTVFIRPKFFTKEYQGELESGKSYTADISEEIITQEMSKRQKKKYLSGDN